jgi:DNA helicase-2/ATP-dependent DNA helicase PcrA
MVSDTDDYDERARVTLMTLHGAKGLEFSTVILAGMEEGLFPNKLSLQDEAALEEERRLCYVGMTRARDRLILTWAQTRRAFGQESSGETRPSRFLKEIPRLLLEPVNFVPPISKPRTTWANAANSVASAERFLEERAHRSSIPLGARELARAPRSARHRWELGTQVRHAKYGVGTVIDCEGEGQDAKLTISFPDYGQKKLIERFASLERL